MEIPPIDGASSLLSGSVSNSSNKQQVCLFPAVIRIRWQPAPDLREETMVTQVRWLRERKKIWQVGWLRVFHFFLESIFTIAQIVK